jgi:hypothetical protein
MFLHLDPIDITSLMRYARDKVSLLDLFQYDDTGI